MLNTLNIRDICLLLSIIYKELSMEQVASIVDKELENGISLIELSSKVTSIILGYDITEDIKKQIEKDDEEAEQINLKI